MDKYSCKNCTERTIGCHSKCEKYIKENEKHKDERSWLKTINRNISRTNYMIGYFYGTASTKKEMGRKGYA